MPQKNEPTEEPLIEALTSRPQDPEQTERKIALLQAIIRISRETADCETEEEAARVGLRVAEELTGSRISFLGELNELGHFDTTTLSEAGWDACGIPHDEAVKLLKNMPNRGINRVGLSEQRSWIINEPASHPAAVRKPEGHPPINSFLGVPLRFAGGITGMMALANKESGYTEEDRQQMEALVISFVETLNRRRAERKISELNRELERHLAQLEDANRELEAFSYSVSHDLRAPLRHITGFVELLNKKEQDVLDEKSRHYLKVISDAATKMGTLIDDLLVFSRMGRSEMRTMTVDAGRLVRESIGELEPETRGRDIRWEIGELPPVKADAAMLRLVLTNLISNALKFTRPRPQARITIGALTDRPKETRLFVRDNGVGFEMKYAERLFALFQRLHSEEEFEGTGVGLANVQRIIHRHGGRVWAEGSAQGATFWISLPGGEEV